MRPIIKIVSLVVPLVLLGLIITAGIALYRIKAYAIPLSRVTATATIILPVITGIGLRSAQTLASRPNGFLPKANLSFSWTPMVVFILLIIYDTVIATLALTHMVPPASLTCPLQRQWEHLFSSKNVEVIRRIQDRHKCCGLRNKHDKAWPFPDKRHTVNACAETFNRERGCLGEWRKDVQITAGLLLLVAVVVFLLKLLMLLFYRSRDPFPNSRWTSSESASQADEHGVEANGEQVQATNVRGRIEGAYHDDPLPEIDERDRGDLLSEAANDRNDNQGRVMQPSSTHNQGNEW